VLILSFENLLSPWNSFIVLTRVKSFQALALWQIDPELLSIEGLKLSQVRLARYYVVVLCKIQILGALFWLTRYIII